MTNLQSRILAAAIYFPALLLSTFDERIFSCVVFLLMGLSWYEMLSFKEKPVTTEQITRVAVIIFLGSLPALVRALGHGFEWVFAVYALVWVIYLIQCIRQHKSLSEMSSEMSFYVLGLLYITLLFGVLLGIRKYPGGKEALWFLFLIVGISDSMAYFTGMKFGRRPFFQNISPKKTMEGFWGGLVFAVIGAAIFWFALGYLQYPIPSLGPCLFLGLAVAFFGVFGDLFESKLKRHFGVKDSGTLFGGHGGALDRFDAVLFASVPLFLYIVLRDGFI